MQNNIFTITLDIYQTFGLSVAILLVGRFLASRVGILKKFCIPDPVVGGLLYAILILIGHATGTFAIDLDMGLKNFFMVCFFTTVGFNANFAMLKKIGIGVILFLIAASALCVIQNGVGVGLATVLGENPLLGIALGSVPLTGGHGTSGAVGPVLEAAGLMGGNTIAIAGATFGLVAGSLMGGPVAMRLIKKNNLKSVDKSGNLASDEAMQEALKEKETPLISECLSNGFFQIAIAIGLGTIINMLLVKIGLTSLPIYIGPMVIAAAMANIFKYKGPRGVRIKEITALGDAFLGVFLAQALMDLRLWELAHLAGPIIIILTVQVIIMFLFAYYITFNIMGKDYDAAVISAGHCGFGLGATPNGVANMTCVVRKFGPSTKAFLILPIVGSLFIDFINNIIITVFISIFK